METGSLVLYSIRRKFLVLAYIIWFFSGIFGVHRLYAKGRNAFYPQFLFGCSTLIISILSLTLSDSITLFLLSLLMWFILFLWLIADFYWIYKWVKGYNLSLYEELFLHKPTRNI